MKAHLLALLVLAQAAYAEQFTVRDSLGFLIRILGGFNLQAVDSADYALILVFVAVILAMLAVAGLLALSIVVGIVKKLS
jgi:hypothetical protein